MNMPSHASACTCTLTYTHMCKPYSLHNMISSAGASLHYCHNTHAHAGGSVAAHAALGGMAERGEGLPGGLPDQAAAARHYAAAAAGGHRDAATAYAYLLVRGS